MRRKAFEISLGEKIGNGQRADDQERDEEEQHAGRVPDLANAIGACESCRGVERWRAGWGCCHLESAPIDSVEIGKAACRTFSCVAFSRGMSLTIFPWRMTRMRSEIPRSSGSLPETTTTPMPAEARE